MGTLLMPIRSRLLYMFRPADRFREQFLYGHREILIAYAGLPKQALLCGRVQHGWDLWFEGARSFRGPNGRPARQWVWSEDAARRASERGIPRVHAIGAPWLYLSKLRNSGVISPSHVKGRDVLFVPAHYGPHASVELHSHHVRTIEQYLGSPSTTVLLHGYDFVRPAIQSLYARSGIATACAGYPAYPPSGLPPSADIGNRVHFLSHILELMHAHTRLATDFMGSHVFYATNAGLPVGYWPLPETYWTALLASHTSADRELFLQMNEFQQSWSRELEGAFGVSDALVSASDRILGTSVFMSQHELKEVLAWQLGKLPESPFWQNPSLEFGHDVRCAN